MSDTHISPGNIDALRGDRVGHEAQVVEHGGGGAQRDAGAQKLLFQNFARVEARVATRGVFDVHDRARSSEVPARSRDVARRCDPRGRESLLGR